MPLDTFEKSLENIKENLSSLVTIELRLEGVDDASILKLAELLPQCSVLSRIILTLDFLVFEDEAASTLAAAFSQCAALKNISINCSNTTSKRAEILIAGITNCAGLQELELDLGLELHHSGDNNEVITASISKCTNLRKLILIRNIHSISPEDNISINDNEVKRLAEALANCVMLEKLELNIRCDRMHQVLDVGAAALSKTITALNRLQEISVNLPRINHDKIQSFMLALTSHNLSKLSIEILGISAAGIGKLAEDITKCALLKEFTLIFSFESYMPIDINMPTNLFVSGTTLLTRQNEFAAFTRLIDAIGTCLYLEKLMLSARAFNLDNIVAFKRTITGLLSLKSLGIMHDDAITASQFTAEIAEAIHSKAAILEDLKLTIFAKSSAQITDSGMTLLASELSKCTSLRILDLSNNHLGDDALKALNAALPESSNLEELYLDSNGLTDLTANTLAPFIKRLTKLQCLKLDHGNSLSIQGFKVLAIAASIWKKWQVVRFACVESYLTRQIESYVACGYKNQVTQPILAFSSAMSESCNHDNPARKVLEASGDNRVMVRVAEFLLEPPSDEHEVIAEIAGWKPRVP